MRPERLPCGPLTPKSVESLHRQLEELSKASWFTSTSPILLDLTWSGWVVSLDVGALTSDPDFTALSALTATLSDDSVSVFPTRKISFPAAQFTLTPLLTTRAEYAAKPERFATATGAASFPGPPGAPFSREGHGHRASAPVTVVNNFLLLFPFIRFPPGFEGLVKQYTPDRRLWFVWGDGWIWEICPCDEIAPPSGSGSGSGSGAEECVPGDCDECADPPFAYFVLADGFEGETAAFSRIWYADQAAGDGTCAWVMRAVTGNGLVTVSVAIDDGAYALTFRLDRNDGTSLYAVYAGDVPGGGCCEVVSLTRISCDDGTVPSCPLCATTPVRWAWDDPGFSGPLAHFAGGTVFATPDPCIWRDRALTGGSLLYSALAIDSRATWLTLYTPAGGAYYTGPTPADCCEPLLLERTFPATNTNAPDTLTLTPVCVEEGTTCPPNVILVPDCCGGITVPPGGSGSGSGSGAVAGTVESPCCPDDPIASTLRLTFANGTGSYAQLDTDEVDLFYDAAQSFGGDTGLWWEPTNRSWDCEGGIGQYGTWRLRCAGGVVWKLSVDGCASFDDAALTFVCAAPFQASGHVTGPGGDFDWQVDAL